MIYRGDRVRREVNGKMNGDVIDMRLLVKYWEFGKGKYGLFRVVLGLVFEIEFIIILNY